VRNTLILILTLLFSTACFNHHGDGFLHRGPGWVMKHPDIHLIFWGDYWTTTPGILDVNTYMTHWDTLINAPGHVFDRLGEYGVGKGDFDVHPGWATPPFDLNGITEVALEQEIQAEIGHVTPEPGIDTIYAVMLPPGVRTELMSAGHYGGYHYATFYQHTPIAYSVTAYGRQDVVLSHELYESASDPSDLGWRTYDSTSLEVGDMCEGQYVDIDGLTVQKLWSNNAGGCQ
jgi:hypothetical protein